MPSEVESAREMARQFWSNGSARCPRHAGGTLTGTFERTTFADHIVLECDRGRETITIPQRPRQVEFQGQQVEGLVENLQRGDSIKCYRCQASMETASTTNADGLTDYTFTCIRCFSWGRWVGKPELAKIGKG